MQRRDVESLEQDLCGGVAVASGVQGRLCQENRMLETMLEHLCHLDCKFPVNEPLH